VENEHRKYYQFGPPQLKSVATAKHVGRSLLPRNYGYWHLERVSDPEPTPNSEILRELALSGLLYQLSCRPAATEKSDSLAGSAICTLDREDLRSAGNAHSGAQKQTRATS
jgi:hypothetical protein